MLPVSFAVFSVCLSQHAKYSHHPDLALEECLHLSCEAHLCAICPEYSGWNSVTASATLIQALPKPGCSTRSHPGLSLPKPPWSVFCPRLRSTHSTLYLPFMSEENPGHLTSSAHLAWRPTCPGWKDSFAHTVVQLGGLELGNSLISFILSLFVGF